ncbi:MAG: hypothetical protein K5865_01700 [Eubacterium sp.]|nr:hypothetical protein [Eubacterium sp.]
MKKITTLVLVLCMLLMICGCGETDSVSSEGEVVFTFDGQEVTIGEVFLYANTVKDKYESDYGENIWGEDVSINRDDSVSLEDVTRKDIIEDIVHVKLLVNKANEYKVALTDEETTKVAAETDDFYEKLTDDQISEMKLSYDLVKKVMNENAIARKVYNTIIEEAAIEVSDEEARETTIYDLFFEAYSVASSGDVTKFSDDEKQAQYERALQAYNTLINPIENTSNDGTSSTATNSTNIEGLAEYYGLVKSSYYTYTPEEIRDIYGDEIADSLYALEDGSYSLVTESEYGYHIFYMKALTDRDATDAHKQELIRFKRNDYMNELYKKWIDEKDPDFSYEDSVNFDVYSQIKF